jgi:hypothetical protein
MGRESPPLYSFNTEGTAPVRPLKNTQDFFYTHPSMFLPSSHFNSTLTPVSQGNQSSQTTDVHVWSPMSLHTQHQQGLGRTTTTYGERTNTAHWNSALLSAYMLHFLPPHPSSPVSTDGHPVLTHPLHRIPSGVDPIRPEHLTRESNGLLPSRPLLSDSMLFDVIPSTLKRSICQNSEPVELTLQNNRHPSDEEDGLTTTSVESES